MELRALRNFNLSAQRRIVARGEIYETDASTGNEHIRRGLAEPVTDAKAASVPQNKMLPPTPNKAPAGNLQAAGAAPPSSASPAAPRSTRTTAEPWKPGELPERKPAAKRPRKGA